MDRFLAAQTAYNTSSKAVVLGCLKICSTKSFSKYASVLFTYLFTFFFSQRIVAFFLFLNYDREKEILHNSAKLCVRSIVLVRGGNSWFAE